MTTSNVTFPEDEDRMTKLLHGGKYSDFTVRCGDRTWKAHRAILCARSTYFEALCESGFKEASEYTVTFEEDDPELIEQMLLYLYSSQYPINSNQLNQVSFTNHVGLYAVADKYNLPSLKKVVKSAFVQDLGGRKVTAEEFAQAAHLAYTTTPDSDRGLRDVIYSYAWRHFMLSSREFQKCVFETESLKTDMLKMLFKNIHTAGSLKKSGRKDHGCFISIEP